MQTDQIFQFVEDHKRKFHEYILGAKNSIEAIKGKSEWEPQSILVYRLSIVEEFVISTGYLSRETFDVFLRTVFHDKEFLEDLENEIETCLQEATNISEDVGQRELSEKLSKNLHKMMDLLLEVKTQYNAFGSDSSEI